MKDLLSVIPGDEVACKIGVSKLYGVFKVKKVDHQGNIELETGRRYRPDGYPIGKTYEWASRERIEPVTEEILNIIKRNRLVSKLAALDYNVWRKMDLVKLEAIVKIIEEDKDE